MIGGKAHGRILFLVWQNLATKCMEAFFFGFGTLATYSLLGLECMPNTLSLV